MGRMTRMTPDQQAAPQMYWVAVCRHAACDWKVTMRVQSSADDFKDAHESQHPGHRVIVVGIAQS